MKTRCLLLSLLGVLAGTHSQAAVLGQYVFGADNVGSTSPAAAFEATSVIAGSRFGDINLTGSAITSGNFFTSQTTAGGQPSRILSTQTAGTTVAASITNNSYFQFTLTPGVGQTIDFTSISLDAARGGVSPRGFSIASSVDSYATIFTSLAGHPAAYNAVAGIATQEDIYANDAFDLSSLSGITTATTFRVYSWSGAAPIRFITTTSRSTAPFPSQLRWLSVLLACSPCCAAAAPEIFRSSSRGQP